MAAGSVIGGKDALIYDGTAFARAGVVLMSINYRMGLEGFTHIPGGDSNLGLRDALAALAWQRRTRRRSGATATTSRCSAQLAGAMMIADLVTSAPGAGPLQAGDHPERARRDGAPDRGGAAGDTVAGAADEGVGGHRRIQLAHHRGRLGRRWNGRSGRRRAWTARRDRPRAGLRAEQVPAGVGRRGAAPPRRWRRCRAGPGRTWTC